MERHALAVAVVVMVVVVELILLLATCCPALLLWTHPPRHSPGCSERLTLLPTLKVTATVPPHTVMSLLLQEA
jgi:hypothetical protein